MNPLRWKIHDATLLGADVQLSQQWDELNRAQGDLPFLDASAIAIALREFGSGRERLFVGSGPDGPGAMLVLMPEPPLRWRTFQPSQLPLGACVGNGLSAVDLARSLLDGPLRSSLALSLTQLDPAAWPRSVDRASARHADYVETAWIDVHGSFDDYWNARGKNLRQNLRKQRNRLEAQGKRLRLVVLREPEDVRPALLRYGQLESAGWKAAQGTAIHPGNAQGRFYAQWLESAARRGEAVVFEYTIDDSTVAMELGVIRDGVLVVLKTTYDERLSSLSPASLLREEALRALFDGGMVRRIEFYGRLMEWHTRLTDHKRTLYHLTAYRWNWVERLAQRRRKLQPDPSLEPAKTGTHA